MKVEELINKLNKLDQNLDVIFYSEDRELLLQGGNARVMDVLSLNESMVRLTRDDFQSATIDRSDEKLSHKYALLEMTSDI